MAHCVSSMTYVGKTPWHGLGNALPSGQPIEVWADQAGMNWQIRETPVLFAVSCADEELMLSFEEQKVLYRSDSNLPLSVVRGRYKVVQPLEVLEFYRDLTEQFGFELETAGVLKQGRKFWALARTGQSSVLAGNDVVNGYVLLATSCDGSLATVVTPTTVRVVCNNTLSVAVNRSLAAESIKVPHNTVFNATEIKRKLNMTVGQWDDFMLLMKALVKRKVSAKESEQFFRNVLSPVTTFDNQGSEDKVSTNGMMVVNDHLAINTPSNILPFTGNNAGNGPSTAYQTTQGAALLDTIISNTGHMIQAEVNHLEQPMDWSKIPNGRAIKKVQTLYEGHGRGAELQAAKGTAWGLLCAMTEFVDHERQARNQENRLDSAWFGQGAQLKQQALSQALKLIA